MNDKIINVFLNSKFNFVSINFLFKYIPEEILEIDIFSLSQNVRQLSAFP